MIDQEKRESNLKQKEKVRRRMHVSVDRENYEFFPAKKQIDYYDNDTHQRVAIYVRVSTDDIRQTTSFELQKKYYEDFVIRHPNWELVGIYADEGISGTSLKHRDSFQRMIADCKAGKIDMIITKSVSRFARNVMICIGVVRELAELKHPVGVFFESECIFSLNDDSQMALSFQATMAEEESHTRSRSMETSLRMRLDNGIPLTPKLLGYTHDEEGNLIINPEEAETVKLTFYMYLYGYSTQQIADALIALGRKSYLGNIKWTSGGVTQILRNERHCGDVLTRKTYTPDYHTHLSKKNRGERPQSLYHNHHEAIVTRDDFIAVQRMLDNAKYKNKSLLPELRVIQTGILKGFVSVNPRWSGFKEDDYLRAGMSAYSSDEQEALSEDVHVIERKMEYSVSAGDFDLRGFEVARPELFDYSNKPSVTFADKKIKFSTSCVRKFGSKNQIEILINPVTKRLAIRPATDENRNKVVFSKTTEGVLHPKEISAAAFYDTLFGLLGWNLDRKYRMTGSLFEKDNEVAYIFDSGDTEVFFKSYAVPIKSATTDSGVSMIPSTQSRKHIRAIPEEWTTSFGPSYYLHEQSFDELEMQSEEDWKLKVEGELYETGKKLNVTDFRVLQSYIRKELLAINLTEVCNE